MQENNDNDFYYPDNLNAKTTVIGWSWGSIIIISICFVVSLIAISAARLIIPMIFTAFYAFGTFKIGDTSICKQLIILASYLFADQTVYLLDTDLKINVPVFYRMKRREKRRGKEE